MRFIYRAVAVAAVALPLAVVPAAAQDYRGAFGIYGGGIWFSDLNNGGPFDFDDDFDDFDDDFDGDIFEDRFADLSLETGWVLGTQIEYWFGSGRFGLRANGAYTERSLDLDGGAILFDDIFTTFGDESIGDVNTWFLDGNVLIRLLEPERDRRWAPYLAVGAGAVFYNPAGDVPLVIPAANAVIGDASVTIFNGDSLVVDLGEGNSETKFAGVIGIGTDYLPGWSLGGVDIGFRAELVDHIAFESPADPLFFPTDRIFFDDRVDDRFDVIDVDEIDDDYDAVHNVRLTLGVHTLFGNLFPEEVIETAPAPPAPPAPEEEMLRVCVVDPDLPERVGYVDAVFRPATGDTLIVENGAEMDLEEAYPGTGVVFAEEADWYIAGEPMTLTVAGDELQFTSFGGERIIEPEELAYLGSYRGTPVFAAEDDVDDIRDELEDARETEDDLEDILEDRAELRDAIGALDVVYVPVQPTGCVFQPFRQIEEVRKIRG